MDHIEFISDEEGIVAKAELFDQKAPKTCALVRRILPTTGYFHHALYSGAELAMNLENYYDCKPENATTVLLPWELFFVSLRTKDYFDIDRDFSEIAFFYDRNTGPRMLDGLVKVNVFARFISNQDGLYSLCHRMRQGEGKKKFTIRLVKDGGS
jgi:hypothetical protein